MNHAAFDRAANVAEAPVSDTPTTLAWRVLIQTIATRRSVRAYLPDRVSAETVREILKVAARAPSGTNIQPWRVHILTGGAITAVEAAIRAMDTRPDRVDWPNFPYYPTKFEEPYQSRRRAVGAALYESLGIARRDVQAMRRHFTKNYSFFGAPVGLLLTMDRSLETGMLLDLGMFLQNVMLAAAAKGYATCPQAAFAPFDAPVRSALGIPDSEFVVCGMALGRADWSKPENAFRTPRAPLDDWATFHGSSEFAPTAEGKS